MPEPTTYIFCGGGTGGHLFPALAIAERLHERLGERARFLFLCSQRHVDRQILEAEQVGGAPVSFRPLPARPLSVMPAGLARFAGAWGPSVWEARGAIREARGAKGAGARRVVAVAMGGFVAAPAAQAARAEGVELVLVNLDAVPGKANRWIARRAGRILTAADVGPAGWERIGPIVRRQAMAPGPADACRERLGLDPGRPVLLVTGASQGARSLNELMVALVGAEGRGPLAAWQVIHQAGGQADLEELRQVYAAAGVPAVVEAFVREMGLWWGAAELALARAGAGIVAEVAANRVPAVFAPYPGHRDQHQAHNAAGLVAAGGAVVVEDRESARANLEGLGRAVDELLQDPGRRQAMRQALERAPVANGAVRAAQALAG
jgi:UDP-N-acetylglucosamine--N-acetylmuramyl-(pentapeptide) pyrophosphoryl-undecaprenol N-acetylglucosamine transferase